MTAAPRRTAIGAAIAALMLPLASPAHADWEATRWGMTFEQTLAATNGQFKRCEADQCNIASSEESDALLTGTHQSGEFRFIAYALFDKQSGKLASVLLELQPAERGQTLLAALSGQYGEASIRVWYGRTTSHTWNVGPDHIEVLEIGDPVTKVTLSYQPRR